MAIERSPYVAYMWNTGDPVTQEKMRHIELGIEAIDINAHEMSTSIDGLDSSVTTAAAAAAEAKQIAELARRSNQDTDVKADLGVLAWTYVKPAMIWASEEDSTPAINLASRLGTIESNIETVSSEANTAILWIQAAYSQGGSIFIEETQTTRPAESLAERINDIYRKISIAQGTAQSALSIIEPEGMRTFAQRLTAIDDNSIPTKTLPALITELENAYVSTANDVTYASIDARLEADETVVNSNTSRIRTLEDNTVKYADVKNDFISTDTNKPLSAAKGKELKETIGGSYGPDNTVATAISNALSTAESYAANYADEHKVDKTDIYNDVDYTTAGKVLDARVGKTLQDAIDTLDGSVSNVASEVENARTSSIITESVTSEEGGEEVTYEVPKTYTSLDARLEAIETLAANTTDNIATIANELNMYNTQTGAIQNTNSRVDTIEANVIAMGKEIGMLLEADTVLPLADAIERTGTRMDNISDEIDAAHRTNDDTLSARFTAIELVNAASTTALNALTGRVSTLESSGTVIVENVTYDTEGIPNNISNPSTTVDYLLKNGDKYYYWKYIKTGSNPDTYTWALISGGGSGTGNSSGFDMTAAEYEELTTHSKNTDYYVNESDGVHHYRWVDGDNNNLVEIEIGNIVDIAQIKKYNIATVAGEKQVEGLDEPVAVTYLNLYQYNYNEDNTIIDDDKLFTQVELPRGGGDGSSSAQNNRLLRIGSEVIQKVVGSQILLRVFYSSFDASGSESSTGYATLRTGDTIIFSNRELSSCEVSDEKVNGWKENTAGYHEFDVTNYCGIGNTNFTLTVEVGGVSLGKGWRVNLTDLRLESTAPDNLLIMVGDEYEFPYTPIGTINKELQVIIDKNTQNEITHTVPLNSTVSGVQSNFIITDELLHGKHTIEMKLAAVIGGQTEYSNVINREYIWYDINDESTPIIIASKYENISIDTMQYSIVEIPYQVYKKDASSIVVEYYLDDDVSPYQTSTLTDTNIGTLSYVAGDVGSHTLKILVDEVYITINLNVTRSDKNLSPVNGAVIDFDPTMLSNSAENRLPQWDTRINLVNKTFKLTASPNFNWSEDINGGGYKKDSNGDKCFVIKAGSYIDLDYPMFANDVFGNGAEMKIVFKTSSVRNADAIWYQNTGEVSGKTVGIQLSAHSGWLKTDKAVNATTMADEDTDEDTITVKGITYTYWEPNTEYQLNDIRVIRKNIYRCINATDTSLNIDLLDTSVDLDEDLAKSYMKKWLAIGQLDTEVLATNSYLYFPYSEEDKIELDININKNEANNSFIMSYEDGVPSKAYAYTTGSGGDKISHNGTIHIGSNDCDVYIYRLRYYVKALSTDLILQNFIADGKDLNEKVERYDRNCIYWNPALNDGEGGYMLTKTAESTLDPIKLAAKMPNVKILMLDTDVFTTGKKDFVMNSSLRCIHADGGNIYTSRGDEDNWLFINGFHAGQGTTSDNYGLAARNVDFLFEVDAVHWPTKSKNMGKYKIVENPTYISEVIKGKDASTFDGTSWSASYNAWEPETPYVLGDKVIIEDQYSGIIYSCTKNHTSELAFDARNWKKIGTTSKCSDWKNDDCKVSLTDSSVPNNYFNLKVNVASSENVNNALFQKRYNDFLTYSSPALAAQVAKHHDTYDNIKDVIVKNCMEFVPAVLFVREHNATIATHTEFKDTNWHFYALGNIGDSKKTDYTRAYDPDDMNEFTCENSDNNTNNGQFQSGVFNYQSHDAIETDYAAWNSANAYTTGDIVVYNGMVYTLTGADQAAESAWNSSAWTAITYTGWTDDTPPYFAPRTNPNPMEYIYPITLSQWNVKFGDDYLNRKHMTLVTEEFDGDHSFEFRYACKGDYRDGDLINDTNGNSTILNSKNEPRTKDDVQFDLNHDVMLAMYEWAITATEQQYRTEASEWFVKNAMEFFYAYTHYYTMMDNRAKNTFWHFAKTGIHRKVSRPVEALFHVYETSEDAVLNLSNSNDTNVWTGTFIPATGAFDPSATYYTQYAFDLWVYDCDTALGIDNNGALVFPYGKEDDDYRVDGEPSSGYAFNGAGSIFWRRLKTTFPEEIAEVMNNTGKNCFNSEHLIKEFDDFQNCFPEEIWRLDIERKYIRTYTGASVDNSVQEGKQNARFLMSMMQGRKKYQRRQWVRDLGFYFNSKYNIGDISVNKTEFNIVSPAGDHSLLAVLPDYHLHLTPYQDMYLNVVVGNGTPIPPIRAKANQEYTIKLDDYTAGNFAETRVYISGFKMISKLGNLAPMYPYAFTLNNLDHLKELDVGTDNSGYRNGNFVELPLTNETLLPLLETLNIKNCGSLATPIGLRTANNLRTVEAAGSIIGGIALPEYTQILTLHLPSTVTDLVLNSARFLTDFSITDRNGTETYNSLYTLDINDSDYSSNVHWLDVAVGMLLKESTSTHLSLLKLSTATITALQTIDSIGRLKPIIEDAGGLIVLSGTITITGAWSKVEAKVYTNTVGYYTGERDDRVWNNSILARDYNENPLFPDLRIIIDPTKEEIKHRVTYYYEDQTTILYINDGDTAPDIYSNGTIGHMPARALTPQERYIFGLRDPRNGTYVTYSGWKEYGASTPLSGAKVIQEDTILQEYFETIPRDYTIRWYLDEEKTKLVRANDHTVPYGGGAEEEAPTAMDIHNAHFETCDVSISNGQVTAHIFKGWLTSSANIHPDGLTDYFDIIADIETILDSIPNIFADTTSLTPEQLLIYASLTLAQKQTYGLDNLILVDTLVKYKLGYDNLSISGQTIHADTSDPWYFTGDGNDYLTTSILPLVAGNDAFTLAIDYSLDSLTYNKTFAIIASCYHSADNVRSGLGLFYNSSSGLVEVGFGAMYSDSTLRKAISSAVNANMRNIVVLRHPANSPTLYIYSSCGNETTLPLDVFEESITRTGSLNFNSNAYLNFGALYDTARETILSSDSNIINITNACCNIYWAKYWSEDVGYGECKKLASWPHEYMTYGIPYAYRDNNAIIINKRASDTAVIPKPSIYLATLNTPMHGKIYSDRKLSVSFSTYDLNEVYGWGEDTDFLTVLDKRVYNSLPIKLQSILCKSLVAYTRAVYKTDSPYYAVSRTGENIVYGTVRNYAFAYSIANLQEDADAYENEDQIINPFSWLITNHISLFNRDTNLTWKASTNSNTYYLNLRFPGKAIHFGLGNNIMRVFVDNIESPTRTIADSIGNSNIRSGDIYIDANGAYIYVSNAEINKYGLSIMSTTGNNSKFTGIRDSIAANIDSDSEGIGGWVKADSYFTRSIICNSNNGVNFATVVANNNNAGLLNLSNANATTAKLSYMLAI